MTDRSYPIVVTRMSDEDGGGFRAFVPDLPGCHADGETRAEAVKEAESAIGEWLDEAIRLGQPIPAPGTAVEAAKKERDALYDALKSQDKLIKKQERLLDDARAEVRRVRAAAEALIENESYREDDHMPWGRIPILTVAISKKRQRHSAN